MTEPTHLDIALVLIIVVLICAGLAVELFAYRRLRTKHRDIYLQLGEPGFKNAQAWWSKAYWNWVWFLLTASYRKLGDKSLVRACDLLRLINLGLYLAVAVLIGVVLFM